MDSQYYSKAMYNPPRVEGCTVPTAINFDENATIDDGSCIFLPPQVLGCTNPDANNYNPLANIDDGSCTFSNSNITFNIAGKKAIQTKIGANIFEEDATQFASWTTRAQTLGFQTFYYTIRNGSMNESNAIALNTLASACGVDIAVYYPIENINIVAAFPAFLNWIVSRFSPVFIALDQETITNDSGMTNATYISRSQQVVNQVSSIQCVWDCGLIYKTNPKTVARNQAIAPQPTPPIWGRQYEQIQDICTFTNDQDYNVTLLNNYFSNLLPTYNSQFFSTLPKLTQQVIEQWQNEDSQFTEFLSDAVINFAIGEMVRYTLSNTEKFAYLIWMQLSNLVHGSVKPEYFPLQITIPCFKFAYTMSVAIPYNNVAAQGFSNGSNSYGLIITNQSSSAQTILSSDVKITGKTVSGNFTRNTQYASSWSSSTTQEINISEANITVRPYSVSVITFTTV